jgi:hypothetical protein
MLKIFSLAVVFTLLFTVNSQNAYSYKRGDWMLSNLKTDASKILTSMNWVKSLKTYNWAVLDPGSAIGWDGYLNLTNFTTMSGSFNQTNLNGGNVTSSYVWVNGSQFISVTFPFNYAVQAARGTPLVGTGNLTITDTAFGITKTDVLPHNQTANIQSILQANIVFDTTFPSGDYATGLLNQIKGNFTANVVPQLNKDFNTAAAAYYNSGVWPDNVTLTTSLPELNFTYDLTWTTAPVYTPTSNTTNGSVVYSIKGVEAPAAPTVKKVKGFLKTLEEVNDIPVFDPANGSRQISISTPSLVTEAVSGIAKSGKFTFNVNDSNKQSRFFMVNTDFLARIYPGLLRDYPRDAPITVTANVTSIALNNDLTGNANITFTITDNQSKVLLSWWSVLTFTPGITVPVVNFHPGSLAHITSRITEAPYGFVDAATLEYWIDSACSSYDFNSWSLFKGGLDFSAYVGTVGFTRTSAQNILIGGN